MRQFELVSVAITASLLSALGATRLDPATILNEKKESRGTVSHRPQARS